MKKIILFLITISIFSFVNIKNTYAQTTFYEGEYIPNIWFNKHNPEDNLIYYNQARFIKQTGTNKIAYCLEPFTDFLPSTSYNNTSYNKLNETAKENISLIAHFGYGYQNHTEPKWYAITQVMIWKVTNPYVRYFFTSSKNGNEVTFTEEQKEIQKLIDNYKANTEFNNKTYTIVTNNRFTKTDSNRALNTFTPTDPSINIKINLIETPVLTTGTYNITLKKNSILYNQPSVFYQSSSNQDLIEIGDPTEKINTFTINVVETEVKINKIDKDTNSNMPQGNASLSKTTLSLYQENNKLIQDIKLDSTGTITLTNLDFGTYYIKEKIPGEGYKLNENKYTFTLDENHLNIKVDIPNEVIKGTLKLKKEYGYENNFKPEANISFNIYDSKHDLVQTITTNAYGTAEIILPYGKYTLTQLTTTEGYQKIEPIEFEIKNEETIEYNLKNYRIDVPNTKTESLLNKIINYIMEILCLKK